VKGAPAALGLEVHPALSQGALDIGTQLDPGPYCSGSEGLLLVDTCPCLEVQAVLVGFPTFVAEADLHIQEDVPAALVDHTAYVHHIAWVDIVADFHTVVLVENGVVADHMEEDHDHTYHWEDLPIRPLQPLGVCFGQGALEPAYDLLLSVWFFLWGGVFPTYLICCRFCFRVVRFDSIRYYHVPLVKGQCLNGDTSVLSSDADVNVYKSKNGSVKRTREGQH